MFTEEEHEKYFITVDSYYRLIKTVEEETPLWVDGAVTAINQLLTED